MSCFHIAGGIRSKKDALLFSAAQHFNIFLDGFQLAGLIFVCRREVLRIFQSITSWFPLKALWMCADHRLRIAAISVIKVSPS